MTRVTGSIGSRGDDERDLVQRLHAIADHAPACDLAAVAIRRAHRRTAVVRTAGAAAAAASVAAVVAAGGSLGLTGALQPTTPAAPSGSTGTSTGASPAPTATATTSRTGLPSRAAGAPATGSPTRTRAPGRASTTTSPPATTRSRRAVPPDHLVRLSHQGDPGWEDSLQWLYLPCSGERSASTAGRTAWAGTNSREASSRWEGLVVFDDETGARTYVPRALDFARGCDPDSDLRVLEDDAPLSGSWDEGIAVRSRPNEVNGQVQVRDVDVVYGVVRVGRAVALVSYPDDTSGTAAGSAARARLRELLADIVPRMCVYTSGGC